MSIPVYDYAVRYCLARRSYAFEDGLTLADEHWAELSEATRFDVVNATIGRNLSRWPNIAKAAAS